MAVLQKRITEYKIDFGPKNAFDQKKNARGVVVVVVVVVVLIVIVVVLVVLLGPDCVVVPFVVCHARDTKGKSPNCVRCFVQTKPCETTNDSQDSNENRYENPK